MRTLQIAIGLAVLAVFALANTARAETIEEKVLSFFSRHDTEFVNLRVAENKVCVPAADMSFGRTTESQRKTCIDDHESMIDLSSRRYTKEIAWEYAVKYRDPNAAQLKRELDVLVKQGNDKIDELERKYSRPKMTSGQTK